LFNNITLQSSQRGCQLNNPIHFFRRVIGQTASGPFATFCFVGMSPEANSHAIRSLNTGIQHSRMAAG